MKRAVLAVLAFILAFLTAFAAWYYMRPSVLVLTEDLPYSYMGNMDMPNVLTSDYRTVWRTVENLDRLSRYDMVIDMTIDGVPTDENIYRPEYDARELFLPLLPQMQDRDVFILFDESNQEEDELYEEISEEYPNVKPLRYEYEIDRSFYALMSDMITEGSYVVVFNLENAMEFLRTVDKDFSLVVDYLDAAALEEGADLVAAPDWDSIVREFLSI